MTDLNVWSYMVSFILSGNYSRVGIICLFHPVFTLAGTPLLSLVISLTAEILGTLVTALRCDE